MIFARVCLGAELYYYNASLPEDWGAGWVPYWGGVGCHGGISRCGGVVGVWGNHGWRGQVLGRTCDTIAGHLEEALEARRGAARAPACSRGCLPGRGGLPKC